MLAIFGLGSNIPPSDKYLRGAVLAIAAWGTQTRVSRVYRSHAVLPPDAPPEWDMPYLNMAMAVELNAAPLELLERVKALEAALGRAPRGHWGPREIDIDILALGNTVLSTPALTLPHAELLKRDFALLPFAEVAPEWRYSAPGAYHGATAQELIHRLGYTPSDALQRTDYHIIP